MNALPDTLSHGVTRKTVSVAPLPVPRPPVFQTEPDRRWLSTLIADTKLIEVRHLPSGRSHLCTSVDQVLDAAARHAQTGNLFTSLNRPHAGWTGRITNEAIERIVILPFDFDPVRPTGSNSTAEELAEAIAQRDLFVRVMLARGWPMPALGISGNGAHADFRMFGTNTRETAEMLKATYRLLAERFESDTVHFDKSVSNPGRMWRLYGTVNRKGPQTADRPHRLSSVQVPSDWGRVTLKQLEKLANEAERAPRLPIPCAAPQRPAGSGDYRTLDVVGWFLSHGLYRRHISANVHEVDCPWEAEHSCANPADTIVFEADGSGWPGFFCHHQHCAGRQIRDVLTLWGDADDFCSRAFAGGVR